MQGSAFRSSTEVCLRIKKDIYAQDVGFFHVVNNIAVDIMHDVLEGVAQFELKFEHLTESSSINKAYLLA